MKAWLKYSSTISFIWLACWLGTVSYGYFTNVDNWKDNNINSKTLTIRLVSFPEQFDSEINRFVFVHINRGYHYAILYWKDKHTNKPINPLFGCRWNSCYVPADHIDNLIEKAKQQYALGKLSPVLSIYYPLLLAYILIPILFVFMLGWIVNLLINRKNKS